MKIYTHVQIVVLIILAVSISSCENDFKENLKNKAENNTFENIKLVDNTIQIQDISTLKNIVKSYKINFVEQNEFISEIKNLQDKGFKPLVPLLGKNDTKRGEEFLLRKIELNYNNLSSKSSQSPKEIDFEDKIISDPALTSLLNENREILVGDSLYKYTENGLYFCKKSNKEKMYRYLKDVNKNTEKFTNKNIKNEVTLVADGIMRFVPMRIEALDPEYSGGGGSTITSTPILTSPILTSPRLIKQNLEISYIETNSLFEHIFGASDKVEDYYSDNRRIQVSFWNQNYYFFSSVGCSARLQKREKLLGVSYWEKSYADIIELGVNDVQYDYKFNTPIFELAKYNYNTVFFEYKGVKYNINGQTILKLPTNGPRFIFDTGDPEAGLTIFIHNNQYDLLNAKELNKIIDLLAKQFVNNLPSVYDKVILDNKIRDESLKYNVVKAPSLSNKITFKTLNVKWSRNNDNAITQYFDFNFLFTWKNSYEGVDDYLKGLNGSTAYSNVTADIYGAALHNGEWKGRRLILQK